MLRLNLPSASHKKWDWTEWKNFSDTYSRVKTGLPLFFWAKCDKNRLALSSKFSTHFVETSKGYFSRKIREDLTGVSIALVCNGFNDILFQSFWNVLLKKNIFSESYVQKCCVFLKKYLQQTKYTDRRYLGLPWLRDWYNRQPIKPSLATENLCNYFIIPFSTKFPFHTLPLC